MSRGERIITSKLFVQMLLLCICDVHPKAGGDYITDHGNPSILGKRHMSPDYRPAENARSYSAVSKQITVNSRRRYVLLSTKHQSTKFFLFIPDRDCAIAV